MFKLFVLLVASPLCLGAPLEGFGDATDEDIAQIRAGTYLEMFDENPTYNFNYKVADNEEQTYVAMEESRADNVVTGTYSYVDPLGSLITVTYTAGPMGYSENREVQEGFVQITAKPVKTQLSSSSGSISGSRPQSGTLTIIRPGSSSVSGTSGSSSSGISSSLFGTSSGTSSGNSFTTTLSSSSGSLSSSNIGSSSGSSSSTQQSDIVSAVVSQIQPLISQTVTSAVAGQQSSGSTSTSSSGSSSSSQSDLIASILSQIQPLISQTVSSAIAGSSSSTISSTTSTRPSSQSNIVSQVVSQIQPLVSQTVSSAVSGTSTQTAQAVSAPAQATVAGLFGRGGDFNVRFNTPDFEIEY